MKKRLTKNDPEGDAVRVGLGIVLRAYPDALRTPTPGEPLPPGPYQILITRRPDHTVYGGYWELPGGKCDPGEPADACVVREIREEVGMAVEVIAALPEVTHTYPHGRVRLMPRVCVVAAGSGGARAVEVAEVRWCGVDELDGYDFPEANAAVIGALRGWIAGRGGVG